METPVFRSSLSEASPVLTKDELKLLKDIRARAPNTVWEWDDIFDAKKNPASRMHLIDEGYLYRLELSSAAGYDHFVITPKGMEALGERPGTDAYIDRNALRFLEALRDEAPLTYPRVMNDFVQSNDNKKPGQISYNVYRYLVETGYINVEERSATSSYYNNYYLTLKGKSYLEQFGSSVGQKDQQGVPAASGKPKARS